MKLLKIEKNPTQHQEHILNLNIRGQFEGV